MKKVTELVQALAEPVAAGLGLEIWDVEFVKEAGQRYLRVYIDRPDGGVSIDDCEQFSRAFDPVLDEADPIEEAYTFEVSSAGADRMLKRPQDFQRFMGARVDVGLYRARNGAKSFTGVLAGYEDGRVTIESGGAALTFEKTDVSLVRLTVEF